MATSRTPKEFGRRMRIQAAGLAKGVEQLIRGTFLVVDQVAVIETPIDTGLARANWIASTTVPAEGENPPDITGGQALQQAQSVVGTYRLEFGPIMVTNNVSYIIFLDQGSSRQSPKGMTAAALNAGIQHIRKNVTGKILPTG